MFEGLALLMILPIWVSIVRSLINWHIRLNACIWI